MERRRFIGGSAASLLGAAGLDWVSLPALAAPLRQGDFAFFDQRFEKARRIAASWPASPGPVAIQGDITSWADVLGHTSRERPLQLRGVTTESFRFCAAILVGEHAGVELRFSRIDQDLVAWTMRTTPRLKWERRDG